MVMTWMLIHRLIFTKLYRLGGSPLSALILLIHVVCLYVRCQVFPGAHIVVVIYMLYLQG